MIRLDLTPREHSFPRQRPTSTVRCRWCGTEREMFSTGSGAWDVAVSILRVRRADGRAFDYEPRRDLRDTCHAPRHRSECREKGKG